MTQRTPPIPKGRSLNPFLNRKTTQLRAEEIQSLVTPLLELLPQAALLLDLEEEKILFGNTAALRLTSYSRQELVTQKLDNLFPSEHHPEGRHFLEFEPHELVHTFRCIVIMRNGNALPVEVSPVVMDTTAPQAHAALPLTGAALKAGLRASRFLVLYFEPIPEIEHRQQAALRRDHQKDTLSRLNETIAELFRCTDNPARLCAMQSILPHIARLGGLDALAVYWWEAEAGGMHPDPSQVPCLAEWPAQEEKPAFPAAVSLAEINAVRAPVRWTKGKRMINPLQQHIRGAGFGFSIIIPLQTAAQPGTEPEIPPLQMAGVLTGAAGVAPEEESLVMFEMAATMLTQALVYTTRQSALQNTLEQLSKSFSLSDFAKESLFDCTLLVDPGLRIVDANQGALNTLEYQRHEIIGQEIGRILIADQTFAARVDAHLTPGGENPDRQALFINQLQEALHHTPTTQPQQIKLYRRNGTSFLANYRVVPVNHIDPKSGLLIILQDLSELEFIRKENELLNQRAYLGEVTSSFAHQIRNPINSLSSGIQLLLASVPEDFPDRRVIEDLEVDCERLARIVESGLDFFRKKEYKLEPIRLDRFVNRLVSGSWQHRLYRYHSQVEVIASGDLPSIQADGHALEHVFTNLFDNAVDAMSDNPPGQPRKIIFKFSVVKNDQNQELLETRISDTGPGIPDSLTEQIFNPFFTTKTKGTGVGLSIVRRIVSAHGGTISIINNVGGTTFQLRLPVIRRDDKVGGVTTTTE